jgi:hypothetical protein
MNVEIMGSCGETTGVHYDFTGKAYQLEPALQTWADRWVAHRLGDYLGLDVFLENPAVIFLKLGARPDFALGKRGVKAGRRARARGGKHDCQSH